MAEVELGQLATQKATSPDVRKFGQKMVDDHTKANEKLKSVANQKGIAWPTSPGAKNGEMKHQLSSLASSDFDKRYMEYMLRDHQMDVKEFQAEASNGADFDLKSFAQTTLPTPQEHLKIAEDITSSQANTNTSATSENIGSQQK